MRFAVVDHDGLVVFHSDGTRSLQESFFKECEDDAALKSAVQELHDDLLTAYYLGRPTRMYITRLIGDGAFADPRWALVVFQDNAVLETLNLETLTLALIMFAAFGVARGAVSALLHFFAPSRWTKWFWPDDRKGWAYATVALVNAGVIALFVVDAGRLESMALLGRAAMLTAGAAIATYLIVTLMPASSRRTVVWRGFFWARATFLFVLAGVPAAACFQTAYDFETALLVKSERAHEDVDRAARSMRIGNRVVDRLALSTKRDSGFGIWDSIGIWDLGFGLGFEGGPANPESRNPESLIPNHESRLSTWSLRSGHRGSRASRDCASAALCSRCSAA